MGILVLGKEIVGVARLATTCATSTLNDTSLTSPLGSKMGNLEGKGLITIRTGGTSRGTLTFLMVSNVFTFTVPVFITYTTSSMVTDDSAILVARMIFLTPGGGLGERETRNPSN